MNVLLKIDVVVIVFFMKDIVLVNYFKTARNDFFGSTLCSFNIKLSVFVTSSSLAALIFRLLLNCSHHSFARLVCVPHFAPDSYITRPFKTVLNLALND